MVSFSNAVFLIHVTNFVLSTVDGSYLMTCGSDKKLKLWNPVSGLLLKTYGGHANEVTDAIGSCDSCHIVTASLDKSIIYWDVSTGQPLRRLRCHAGGITCVAFSEDSNVAVSGGKDNLVMWYVTPSSLFQVEIGTDFSIHFSAAGTFEPESSNRFKP